MSFQNYLLALQKWVLPRKTLIIRTLLSLEIALVLVLFLGAYVFFTMPEYQFDLYETGRRFGYIGLFFYWLTLIPGIVSRLQFQPIMGVILTQFRRHFGILMFCCIVIHQTFTTWLMTLATGLLPALTSPKMYGIAATLCLIPMWLTSNDRSQKYLGKKWKILHRLTYVVLFLVFLHVAFFRKRWAIPHLGFVTLEVLSWYWFWNRQRLAKLKANAATAPTSTPLS